MNHNRGLLVLVIFICLNKVILANNPIIGIEQGLIRGTYLTSIRSHKQFIAFMGIPYAKAPVGELRFKEPQPPEHWDNVLNTTSEGAVCPQDDPANNGYQGDEECLFINVYTSMLPTNATTTSLPVMVYIHGGTFIEGSGDRSTAGPDFIVDEDVVLVTFNYRLGILGFLSLQNVEVPGNNGLKDQVFALKWLKRNIAAFGGDPNKVTLFGGSAGAASIHFHLLSPMSKGLFQQAISQSGSSLDLWAYQSHEDSLNLAFDVSKTFAKSTHDKVKVLEKLRTVSAKQLVEYVKKINRTLFWSISATVGPTVDVNASPGNVFLPDNPYNLTRHGKFKYVPYIIGINNREAIFELESLRKNETCLENVMDTLKAFLPYFVGQQVPEEMVYQVKAKYFNNGEKLMVQYIKLLTDLYFVNGAYCTANFQATFSSQPVYSYEFSFVGSANARKQLYDPNGTIPGACHADELSYLFRTDAHNGPHIEPGSAEYDTSYRIVKLWTNFAKTGIPTPQPNLKLQSVSWRPISNRRYPYLSIDTNLKVKENLNNGSAAWWEKLYKKYVPMATPCWNPRLK